MRDFLEMSPVDFAIVLGGGVSLFSDSDVEATLSFEVSSAASAMARASPLLKRPTLRTNSATAGVVSPRSCDKYSTRSCDTRKY